MSQKKVMVVEDEKLLLEAIVRKLGLEGISAEGYVDGQPALDRLRDANDLPDLIWLDYYLGDMTGDVFLEKMKGVLAEDKKVPVMVVSNSASPPKVEEALKNGAGKYLLKADYKLADLVIKAKEMIEGKA